MAHMALRDEANDGQIQNKTDTRYNIKFFQNKYQNRSTKQPLNCNKIV